MSEAIAVTERPILFSAPMVKALLAGTKTQTRRIVTVRNSHRQASPNSWPFDLSKAWRDTSFAEKCGEYLHVPFRHPDEDWSQETSERWNCRWQPGERLWVRETLVARDCAYGRKIAYAADGMYLRNGRTEIDLPDGGRHVEAPKWKWQRNSVPSIHMPRWASRITLEITDVRVQRLAEISEEDAIAEGIHSNNFTGWGDEPGIPSMPEPTVYQDYSSTHRLGFNWLESPVDSYRTLWNSINGPGSWDANLWVWAVSFRRITTTH